MVDTTRLEKRLAEACDALWDMFVDPREAYVDNDGLWWNPVTSENGKEVPATVPFSDERQLAEIRQQCRQLVANNEFAINGVENRISYLVGAGHVYRASIRKGVDAPASLELEVQTILDEFMHINRWQSRQQEIVRRSDRDGEVFLRFFVDASGITRIRFVDPTQTNLRFKIILGEQISLQPDDRFVGDDGTVYQLVSLQQAERLDSLPIAQVMQVIES